MDWINRLRVGRGGDGAEVPREWRAAVKVVLDRISKRGAQELESYVLTGSPASALDVVAARPLKAQNAFGFAWNGFTVTDDADRQVYALAGSVPPEVMLRWASVLEAALLTDGQPALDPVGGAHWAEALIAHAINLGSRGYTESGSTEVLPLSHDLIEELLQSVGAEPSDLLVAAFRPNPHYAAGQRRNATRRLDGYEQAVGRHAAVLRPEVAAPGIERQLLAVEMLEPLSTEILSLFAAELAQLATSTSSQIRTAVAAPFAKIDATEPLKAIAVSGKPEARLLALRLLWDGEDPAVQEWTREQAAADRAPKIRALLTDWDRPTTASPRARVVVETPQIDWKVPVTDELRTRLLRFQADLNKAVDSANAVVLARRKRSEDDPSVANHYWNRLHPRYEDDSLAELTAALEAGRAPARNSAEGTLGEELFGPPVERYLTNSLVGPVGLVILLDHFGRLFDYHGILTRPAIGAFNALHQSTGRPTLHELATMLDELKVDGPKLVFQAYSRGYGEQLGLNWLDEAVWPYVEANLNLVTDSVITPVGKEFRTYDNSDLSAPYRALGTLPVLPARVVDSLFATALGSRKTERVLAQDALVGAPGVVDRVADALADGKADVRTAAAKWLARLREPAAIPALEAAVRKERQDVPKGAMLDALESFGQPVEKYLDRTTLAKQAAVALRKGLPKDLAWLRWEAVPSVRWASTGEAVPVDVLKWFAAQAVKAKSAEPNAVLRKYCALFDPGDRERFGQYLLEAWLAEDVRPISLQEARTQAAQRAGWTHQSMASYPNYYVDDPLLGMSLEELEAHYLPGFSRQPAGSAIGSKGILAIAAACAGERAADPVARYLKEWYGQRAAQGRALIVMLGWIDHPGATQLMLSVGSRFRTKSFQEEATRQAEALAERKGWTVGELADRTIPTAGFDDSGVIELSYGERTFAAVLRPDLSIELRSAEGKKLSSLPAPRQSENEALAKQAKKALTLAKKELKAIVQLQTQRLYEALCTERTWLFEDWQIYLNRHPVVRHLTQRLAWLATTPDGGTVFRPLDDGTLTDVDDEAVKLPPDAVIAIAHDSLLDQATVQSWQDHLADYEIEPLFQQLGKGTFVLPEAAASTKESADFTGHLLEAFALRGRAGKLGYTRGATEDGGWFHQYEKRFPTLGLTTVVGFTGNPLPERNRTVALTTLTFRRATPGGSEIELRLGDVPTVLLSEAYNDLRLMAGDGTGFDPDWERKSEY